MYNTDAKELLRAKEKSLKKNELRYNEYYQMQTIFDNLYKQSKEGSKFQHLFELITRRENLLLAYRTIKRNKGSKTAGTNGHTIKRIGNQNIDDYISYLQERLKNYQPMLIRRVEIPKPNGKKRPLGIPCIEDRLIQQAIKQVLEPICEAKFFEHSYGFRPNRSTSHAIAYAIKKVNIDKCYHIVDIDIKGFFDNVNHAKLLKQLYTIGIQDKRILSIISKMLKAEIRGIGIADKGVPQGGILSPLLANIVLNELDQWIASQWQTFQTIHKYNETYNKYRHLRNNSALKEIYLVRYADDFKIFCKKKQDAIKIYYAVQQWLKERLSLEISEEKSKITDVRKNPSEFLGFKIKAYKKNKKWIVKTNMTDKAIDRAVETIKQQLDVVKKKNTTHEVTNYNSIISGLHNYYKKATEVNRNFKEIGFRLLISLKTKLKDVRTKTGYKTAEYEKKYKGYQGENYHVRNITLYPITYVSTSPPKLMKQEITNYTKEGREKLHKNLQGIDLVMLQYFYKHPLGTVELNDNRISLYVAQKGKDAITGQPLTDSLQVHHILPRSQGGKDNYSNLIIVNESTHRLIHAVDPDIIKYYMQYKRKTERMIEKLNKYRLNVGNERIQYEK